MILVLMLEVFYPAKCLSAASVLDWSARRSHLAGAWGAHSSAVLKRRAGQSENEEQRVVRFSPLGEKAFARTFPI